MPLGAHAHQFNSGMRKHPNWLEDGISIVQISFLLGHEQLETTMKYLDITTEEKASALATLEMEREKSPKMNNIKACARELVDKEIVYA